MTPAQKTDTDIAVLQVQVGNVEEKVAEIKVDLKELHDCMDRHAESYQTMLKKFHEENVAEHKSLSSKISVLEKWRWMIMGAGIVLGSLGFETISKLFK
jgi:lipid II:glycine glycyltransferase (peptidoglycan interpeptide bridge formation enzyme)